MVRRVEPIEQEVSPRFEYKPSRPSSALSLTLCNAFFTAMLQSPEITSLVRALYQSLSETAIDAWDYARSGSGLSSQPLTAPCASSLVAAGMKSPAPSVSYSPVLTLAYQTQVFRVQVIEELLESERTYLASLRLLITAYLELETRSHAHLREVATLILTVHQALYMDLYTHQKDIARVIELITSRFSVFLYAAYCEAYDAVVATGRPISADDRWLKGIQMFLEARQTSHKSYDLSFVSLAQKPIARIGKYHLLVESLVRGAEGPTGDAMMGSYHRLCEKLCVVNESAKDQGGLEISSSLALSTYGYGKHLLAGALTCCWVTTTGLILSRCMCCILFKSHLVVAEARGESLRVWAVIPLAAAKVCNALDLYFSEGLSSTDHAFKMSFERAYAVYEILMIPLDQRELDVWQERLGLLVDFVNGPYAWDWSASEAVLPAVIPTDMAPVEMKVDQDKNGALLSGCYFRKLIPLRVVPFGVFAGTTAGAHQQEMAVVELKRLHRLACQLALRPFWSALEFPLLPERKRSLQATMRSFRQWRGVEPPSLLVSALPPPLRPPLVTVPQSKIHRFKSFCTSIFRVKAEHAKKTEDQAIGRGGQGMLTEYQVTFPLTQGGTPRLPSSPPPPIPQSPNPQTSLA